MKAPLKRIEELDAWRGMAILGMVLFHILWGLDFFSLASFEMSTGAWDVFGDVVRWSFLLLVGIGTQLSYQRALSKGQTKHDFLLKNLQRGLVVFGCGLLVSLGTYLVFPRAFVLFGILHLIGMSILIIGPFVNWPKFLLILSVVVYGMTDYIHSFHSSNRWLAPLGVIDKSFSSLDFFPLFPWLAVPALGVFLGSIFYKEYQRQYPWPKTINQQIPVKILTWIGKRSLWIYMLHIPIVAYVLAFLAGKI